MNFGHLRTLWDLAARAVVLFSIVLLAACAGSRDYVGVAPDFAGLDGWEEDDHAAALPAVRRSCDRFAGYGDRAPIGRNGIAGTARDWRALCEALRGVPSGDRELARAFFETWFTPRSIRPVSTADGLFTGYFEPELNGSRTPSPRYHVPLYRQPGWNNLPSRAAIERGALAGRGLELVWVDDAVDAFFLQIQGSGRVRLNDGTSIGVGYAGQNGHSYYPIGRYLVEQGIAEPSQMSMQLLKRWLKDNPDRAAGVMDLNESYVFFRERPAGSVRGALDVELTPGRSLAVDPAHVPLGIPLWLDVTNAPVPGGALRRLVVAQDTGGAIKGPMRGDLFWGHGPAAENAAGVMKARGGFTMLLPRSIGGRHQAARPIGTSVAEGLGN